MLYVVTNISTHNISHGNDIIKPGEQRKLLSVDNLQLMIKQKHIKCEVIGIEGLSNTIECDEIKIEEKFINQQKNTELTEALFEFYFNKELSIEKIDLIKEMYKNFIIFNKIDKDILNLLDDATDRESLIEVLLNHIYPAMLDNITK